MAKRKQHFVPRFYLKAFQSGPKRIHLYNIKRSLPIENVSLKDQCYKRDFYGPDGETEDFLATLESCLAPTLQSIISSNNLPSYRSEEHHFLLLFVALQLLRTAKASELIRQLVDKSVKQVLSHDPRSKGIDMDSVEFGFKNPGSILMSLSSLLTMKEAISDLKVHLAHSSRKVFITSDNPIFKYNQYCEGVQHMGVTGGECKGLQIFVPISPHLHLILYDGTTYRVRILDRFSRISRATTSDVDSLNMFQLVSADENIYFSCRAQRQNICRLVPKIKHFRNPAQIVVQEYGQDDDPNVSLIHHYARTVDMSLSLTFLSLKRRARQIPLADRPQGHRNQPPRPKHSYRGSHSTTFSRYPPNAE